MPWLTMALALVALAAGTRIMQVTNDNLHLLQFRNNDPSFSDRSASFTDDNIHFGSSDTLSVPKFEDSELLPAKRERPKIVLPNVVQTSFLPSRALNVFDESRVIAMSKYTLVSTVNHPIDRVTYVIKSVLLPSQGSSRQEALDEPAIMASLPVHANIVRYHASWVEPTDAVATIKELVSKSSKAQTKTGLTRSDALFIQMELCNGGTLKEYLERRMDPIDFRESLLTFKQILTGVQQLHHDDVLHLDLKPSNIYRKGDQFKIGDFGLSCRHCENRYQGRGTPGYASRDPKLSKASDVKSLGIILLELFTRFPTRVEFVHATGWAESGALEMKHLQVPDGPDGIAVHDLILSMTRKRPSDRPTVDQVLSLPLFANI
ncbi:Protein kinase domain-containing protein [Plasmodiophora brassicae]|nr:hypothetical protein PBRA_006678 [Plasmodiophora brassicae]